MTWLIEKLDQGFWIIATALFGALAKLMHSAWRKFSTDSARIDLLEREMDARAKLREDDREAVREVRSRVEHIDGKLDDLKDILLKGKP